MHQNKSRMSVLSLGHPPRLQGEAKLKCPYIDLNYAIGKGFENNLNSFSLLNGIRLWMWSLEHVSEVLYYRGTFPTLLLFLSFLYSLILRQFLKVAYTALEPAV